MQHIRRDNTFFIYIDMQRVAAGNLLEDLSPPVNPPAAVSDPNDTKPADWVDEAKYLFLPSSFMEKRNAS